MEGVLFGRRKYTRTRQPATVTLGQWHYPRAATVTAGNVALTHEINGLIPRVMVMLVGKFLLGSPRAMKPI